MCFHTMAILKAYQADLLKDQDEGKRLGLEAVRELLRATDLSLRASKEKARAGSLDAPLSPSGFFGNAVTSVVKDGGGIQF